MNYRAFPAGSFVSGSLLCVLSLGWATAAPPRMSLYGTFNSVGISVDADAGSDPDRDAVGQVFWRRAGEPSFRAGYSLARVGADRFRGSLFFLDPGTAYDVRAVFIDPDGALGGQSADGQIFTREEVFAPAPLRSLHVSPSGSGAECSPGSPCSLGEAVGQLRPGDEVVLSGGVYYTGEWELSRGGVEGAPVVFRSKEGEEAVLDGSYPTPFTWTNEGGGVYRTALPRGEPHMVVSGETRLFPYVTLADLQSLKWGVPGIFSDGATLYVHLAGDADPAVASMRVSRYNFCFYSEQSWFYFRGLDFRYYGQGDCAKTIYFLDASDNVVERCRFTFVELGVGLKYQSHRNVIQDCEFRDGVFDWPWDAVKQDAMWSVEDGGVYVYEPFTGRGTVIRRNVFHDDFDGMHICPWEGDLSSETDVYDNLVYRVGDDGMETDGWCSNVRIWDNVFHDCHMGVSMAPCLAGPVYAIRNLVYAFGMGQTSEPDGSAFKFNSGYDPSGPMYLFHNTGDAVTPGRNAMTLWAPGDWAAMVSRNNTFSGTAYALVNDNVGQPLDWDYDNLFTTSATEFAWWHYLGDDSHLRTFSDFQSATGLEARGVSAAPGFADPAAGRYQLTPLSPLVDRGIPLPGINDRFAGTAPDLGAFEWGPPGDVNGDGRVDALDAAVLRGVLAGYFTEWRAPCRTPYNADWNRTGSLEEADFASVARLLSN